MAKRQRSVKLSFVLLRFVILMLGSMLLCFVLWLFCTVQLQNNGMIYQGYTANQQVEQLLAGDPQTFVSPGNDFLAEYALFSPDGQVLESNVNENTQRSLAEFLQTDANDIHVAKHTYADGSTLIIHWYFRKEFANPDLRRSLPPFEYLWWASVILACILCLVLNTLWLGRRLAAKLKLFGEVSARIGAQDLDFTIPHAGIREYDQVLDAMEHMRSALYSSLSSQWAAQQEREAEIAALAHDLKTPLTLVGGNAELLLEETLPENSRKMVETIISGNDRARQYVTRLLETSAGVEESFKSTRLPDMFDELCCNFLPFAKAHGVHLITTNDLKGSVSLQKDHMLRALGNVVQNAIEYTPAGGCVHLEGRMTENGWQIIVSDEGPGFSPAAIHHGTHRLWRDDPARSADGHNGLGLWFAAQVAQTHHGQLKLDNGPDGAVVTMCFCSDL